MSPAVAASATYRSSRAVDTPKKDMPTEADLKGRSVRIRF